jgi:hypothetical protein
MGRRAGLGGSPSVRHGILLRAGLHSFTCGVPEAAAGSRQPAAAAGRDAPKIGPAWTHTRAPSPPPTHTQPQNGSICEAEQRVRDLRGCSDSVGSAQQTAGLWLDRVLLDGDDVAPPEGPPSSSLFVSHVPSSVGRRSMPTRGGSLSGRVRPMLACLLAYCPGQSSPGRQPAPRLIERRRCRLRTTSAKMALVPSERSPTCDSRPRSSVRAVPCRAAGLGRSRYHSG